MSTTATPMRQKIQERRRISAVATPAGLFTLVDLKFLRELADVQEVTGEHLFAVVDADHLELLGIVIGHEAPAARSTSAVRVELLTKTDIRDLQHFYGWSNKEFAIEMEVSVQRISDWLVGLSIPRRERSPRLYELIDHMAAQKAIESGVPA